MRKIKAMTRYPAAERIFSLVRERKDAVFLDSSQTGALGRFSIIGLHPYLELIKGDVFTVNGKESDESFEAFVSAYLKQHREENDTHLPLLSGAVGYFSYDYGRKKEGVKTRHREGASIPDSILIFYDSFIIEDHREQKMWLIANDYGHDCRRSMEELETLLQQAERLTQEEEKRTEAHTEPQPESVISNFTKNAYMDAVERIIQYITEGDIYIANMTRQLQISGSVPPYEMFRTLRRENPSPFGGYFNYGNFQIISASPERFLEMRNGLVETRPIKGTRRRGSTPEEDAALQRELQQSEKDKSELLMIVDLERNDLNRVCIPGSVQVTELFSVERYATVFHLVSTIAGRIRPGLTAMDLLTAAFPGGSITGAPKLRAMEIIDELERGSRGLYTGSMGYLSLNGDCDLNIVIRTALYQDGVYHLGVGGGITCESELEFEYEETCQKGKALLNAMGKEKEDEDFTG